MRTKDALGTPYSAWTLYLSSFKARATLDCASDGSFIRQQERSGSPGLDSGTYAHESSVELLMGPIFPETVQQSEETNRIDLSHQTRRLAIWTRNERKKLEGTKDDCCRLFQSWLRPDDAEVLDEPLSILMHLRA